MEQSVVRTSHKHGALMMDQNPDTKVRSNHLKDVNVCAHGSLKRNKDENVYCERPLLS